MADACCRSQVRGRAQTGQPILKQSARLESGARVPTIRVADITNSVKRSDDFRSFSLGAAQ